MPCRLPACFQDDERTLEDLTIQRFKYSNQRVISGVPLLGGLAHHDLATGLCFVICWSVLQEELSVHPRKLKDLFL